VSTSPQSDDYYDPTVSFTDNQKQLLLNCIKLINHGRYMQQSNAANEIKTSPTMSDASNYSISASQQRNIPNINVTFDFDFDLLLIG
jgi:hypothetical protein